MPIYTYNLSTDLGKMRLLIADTDIPDGAIFSDEELTALLTMEGNVVKAGAARALEVLAANKARLAVRVQRGGVSEDLTQVAKELRATAGQLRAEAEAESDDQAMAVFSSPSWERFSYTKNVALERETSETG